MDKSRIANDPAFQRTRENGSEFGRAGRAGRSLRTAFRPLLLHCSDSRITTRLTQEMMKVIKADQVSERGLRNVLDGELELLKGFDFNSKSSLGTTLYMPYTATIDRATGNAVIEVPGFVPKNSVVAPQGATHVRFISAAAEINFETGDYNTVNGTSEEIALSAEAVEGITLANQLNAGSELPLFLLFGLEFYQVVNGQYYPLNSGVYNALSIVAVDGLSAPLVD